MQQVVLQAQLAQVHGASGGGGTGPVAGGTGAAAGKPRGEVLVALLPPEGMS